MRRKTYERLRYIGIRTIIALIVIGFVYIYFFTSTARIQNIVVYGISEEEQRVLSEQLQTVLTQPLLGFIPGDRVLTYYEPRLDTAVYEMFPYIETLHIRPTGLHTLSVTITLKTSLFKTEEGLAMSEDGSIYTDTRDVSMLPVLYASTTPNKATLQNLSFLSTSIRNALWPITMVKIDEYHDVYLYSDEHEGYIVTTLDADVQKVWSTLLSAADTEPLKSGLSNNRQRLAYIDVRYGNKVFYKFTNKRDVAIIPEHEDSDALATTTVQN